MIGTLKCFHRNKETEKKRARDCEAIDLRVSRIFRPNPFQLSVGEVITTLNFSAFDSKAAHPTSGILFGKNLNNANNETISLFGTKVNRNEGRSSPCTDRRHKLQHRDLLEDYIGDLIPFQDRFPLDSELNDFPSWYGQLRGIELFAPQLMFVHFDESALRLIKEFEQLWLTWNSEMNTNFSDELIRHLVSNRRIYFDKKPFWDVSRQLQNTANTMLLHKIIAHHFWVNVAPKLCYDWEELSRNASSMLIEDLSLVMENYLRNANKITKFEWTLDICELMLAHKDCWLEVLQDEKQTLQFFNSVAALQSHLLCELVYINVNALKQAVLKSKTHKPFYIKIELNEGNANAQNPWDILSRIVEIGTDILRVECRMYPTFFPTKKYFSINGLLNLDAMELKMVNPYKEIFEVFERLQSQQEDADILTIIELAKQYRELQYKTRMIREVWFVQPYEFDFAAVKLHILTTANENIKKLNQTATEHILERIKNITEYYGIGTSSLYGKDQLTQVYSLVLVRDEYFPKLKEMVKDLHQCFWGLADEFNFTEITMQKYFQASRTTYRLCYMADLVWQKILVDRSKVEEMLLARSNELRYQALMLEDSTKAYLKRYRNIHSIIELRTISNRLRDLYNRALNLSAECPILVSQQQLLGIDPTVINEKSIERRLKALAIGSALHYSVLSYNESIEEKRVIDVAFDEVNLKVAELVEERNNVDLDSLVNEEEDDAVRNALDLSIQRIDKVLDRMAVVLPLIKSLSAEGMQLRHWRQILPGANLADNAKEVLLVGELFALQLEQVTDDYKEVSLMAGKEMTLEESLSKMKSQWETIELHIVHDNLTNVDEIEIKPEVVSFIEEQIIKTQMNISSPFSGTVLPQLRQWLEQLQKMQKIVDIYQKCSTKWAYLEPLFNGDDVAYQMPAEWRIFQTVSEKWRNFTQMNKIECRGRFEITAIINTAGELLRLSKPVNILHFKRHIDKWLVELERQMKASVKAAFVTMMRVRGADLPSLYDLTTEHGGQISILHLRVVLTAKIETAITTGKLEELMSEFNLLLAKMLKYKAETEMEKIILHNAMIDVYNHQKIVRSLIGGSCESLNNQLWVSQLRYYFDGSDLFIKVSNITIPYGYEYMCLQAPFVITPQVHHIQCDLLSLQSQGYVGMLYGPAATGKSEAVRELARTIGSFFVVFNCSPETDRAQLEELICGTILSGSVLCLDEFNRLSIENMAWFASHMLGIYQAKRSELGRYRMKDLHLPVSKGAAFYLTINPKFLARSELPANIYSVVRAMAMNEADIQSIAAAYLLLAGFVQAESASSIIVDVFSRCATLLSSQNHYDFQLRSAMATVQEATELKSRYKDEKVAVGAAIRLILMPYLVNKDYIVFERILKLALKQQSQLIDLDTLTIKLMKETIEEMKLCPSERFLNACFNLYRLSRQRQSFILLGRALSGKSTCVAVVKRTLKLCSSIHCRLFKFNPSQLDVGSLYGKYDAGKIEWIAGLLSHKLSTQLNKDEEGWIVLDGILDSTWVESMNSMFDSNKKLCLANGESVPFQSNMRVLFECDSLKRVAPSTISRCQVIFFSDDMLALDIPTWHRRLGDSAALYFLDCLSHSFLRDIVVKKIFMDRCVYLVTMYKTILTVPTEKLYPFILYVIARSVADPNALSWIRRCGISKEELAESIGEATGRELDPEDFDYHFFALQLIQFSNFFVVLYGNYGDDKIGFAKRLVSALDPQKWYAYVFDMSEDLTPEQLLTAFLSCKLIRVNSAYYTGDGEKNVLFILRGMERLPIISMSCVLEGLRSLFDNGRILLANGETIRFTSVHFLGLCTTEHRSPFLSLLPERLKRHIFPIHIVDKLEPRPLSLCRRFVELYDDNPENETKIMGKEKMLQRELSSVCEEIPREVRPLCGKYLQCVSQEDDGPRTNQLIIRLPNQTAKEFDIQHLQKYLCEQTKNPTVHEHTIRQFAFLYKALSVSNDAHCVILSEPENDPGTVCRMVADILGYYYEVPPSQLTEIYWREAILKLVQMCLFENRHIMLFLSDDIPTQYDLAEVLSDLSVILDSGSLPMRLFGIPHGNAEEADSNAAFSFDWERRSEIADSVRSHFHVVVSMSWRSVRKYSSIFYDIFHNAFLTNFDNWTRGDMLSFASTVLMKQSGQSHDEALFCADDVINVHQIMSTIMEEADHARFITFVQTYCEVLRRVKTNIETREFRYITGIEKLDKADEQMNFLQEELVRLQPELVRTSLETTVLMSAIERETIEIENAREVVAANEFKANEAATRAQALKAECEAELAEALPALESAMEALEILNQRDISSLKTMRNPPQAVRLCMEAVCILLGEPPVRVKQAGKSKLDYWATALKVMSDIHFLSRLHNFDKNKIPPNVIKLIRANYVSKDEFSPEHMQATSLAAMGLCLWVRAIDTYEHISSIVEPKKLRLKKAENMVKQNMKQLEQRRRALQDVTERLQGLSDHFSQMSQRKQDLQNQIQVCEARVNRAERLLNALGGERTRWESIIAELKEQRTTYQRTTLVAAAIITYLSDVEYDFRKRVVDQIQEIFGIWSTYSMRSLLPHISMLRAEKNEKIVETYTILEYSWKVPFIIDPHGQSRRMLPRLLGDRLVVLDAVKKELLPEVISAIENGKTLVVDNISYPVPFFVTQLIKRTVLSNPETNIKYMQIENNVCNYNDEFRLFLRSDRIDSAFGADFLKSISIVHISLGQSVIEENVMDLFLNVKAPNLREKKEELGDETTKCLIQLDQLEERILDALGKNKDLDNDRIVDMLGGVKELSSACDSRTMELNAVEDQLKNFRKDFAVLARKVAWLIDLSVSLYKISPLYLRTLRFYFDIFHETASGDPDVANNGHVDKLSKKVTAAFREKILPSLFSVHRSVYDMLTKMSLSFSDVIKMSQKDFVKNYMTFDTPTDINLWTIIESCDSSVPTALILTSASTYIVKNLYNFAELVPRDQPANRLDPMHNFSRIQMITADTIETFDWKYALQDDQWLVIQNCQLMSHDQTAALETLLDQTKRKEMQFRICCFHYALMQRCQYPLFGWTNEFRVTMAQFESTIHGYRELCNRWEDVGFELLYDNVLLPIYMSEESLQYDRIVFSALAKWIFVGTNKFDDAILEKLFQQQFHIPVVNFHEQLSQKPLPSDSAMSGLSDHVLKALRRHKAIRMHEFLQTTYGTEPLPLKSRLLSDLPLDDLSDEGTETIEQCIENEIRLYEASHVFPEKIEYLRKILVQHRKGGDSWRIQLNQLEKPHRILDVLKEEYARKHRITAEETLCVGLLKSPTGVMNQMVEFSGCWMCCASYSVDYSLLQEGNDCCVKIENIWVSVRRRPVLVPKNEPFTAPLYHRSNDGRFSELLNVELESNLPDNHWFLRGVKLLTFSPLKDQ